MSSRVYDVGLPGSALPPTPAATRADDAVEIFDYYVEQGVDPLVAHEWAIDAYIERRPR